MRGALNDGVTPALRHALTPATSALDRSDISTAMYAIARDCRWTISGFHWRPIYCTFHLCFVHREQSAFAMVIGADSPILALSDTSSPGEILRYIDDAAFSSAASGYAPDLQVLPASELSRDLSDSDVAWLVSLGRDVSYNLKYWRPQTVGEVIFNTWD